jgi:hypothetical protein
MLTDDFLTQFQKTTEARWASTATNPILYGFQFQQGTRWHPGL